MLGGGGVWQRLGQQRLPADRPGKVLCARPWQSWTSPWELWGSLQRFLKADPTFIETSNIDWYFL